MKRIAFLLPVIFLTAGPVHAGSGKVDHTLRREPAYASKTPRYALLKFGPEGKDRVWLVRDGNTLYVDRNGDGDLTEPGKKVDAEKTPGRDPAEDGFSFQAGDITIGGRTHKALAVYFTPLQVYAGSERGQRADVQALLAHDPKAMGATVTIDVAVPGMHGGGIDGRVSYEVGNVDLNGVFQFARRPADAPVVHLGGPLEVTFYGERPSLLVGRTNDLCLVVGTRGVGPGTFAMVQYQGTIPDEAKPLAEAFLPPAKPDDPPLKETWLIKGRC